MEPNKSIYLDIGTSTIKTTILYDDKKYLVDEEFIPLTPKIYSFPRFVFSGGKEAESPEALNKELELTLCNLFQPFIGSSFIKEQENGIQTWENIDDQEQKNIMHIIYNMMIQTATQKKNEIPSAAEMLPLFLTEKLFTRQSERAKIIEYAFEELHVPVLHIACTPSLIQYSECKETGVVIELSESQSSVVCVKDGYVIKNFAKHFPASGREITEELISAICKNPLSKPPAAIKVLTALVRDGAVRASDYPLIYKEKNIDIDKTIKEIVESKFFPNGTEMIHLIALECIKDTLSGIGSSNNVFDNLVVAGGISPIGGADDLIIKNINEIWDKKYKKLTPRKAACGLFAPVVGARIFAATPGISSIMANKASYYENGAEYLAQRVI